MEAMTNIPGISRGLAAARMHKVLYDPLPIVMEIKQKEYLAKLIQLCKI